VTFAPFARSEIFLADLPIPLEPDVANGMIVLPARSYSSTNVSIMEGSLYHQIGNPTKTAL